MIYLLENTTICYNNDDGWFLDEYTGFLAIHSIQFFHYFAINVSLEDVPTGTLGCYLIPLAKGN
jgi:hypothetical protein